MRKINLAGKRFGRLVAISQGVTTRHKHVTWKCRCDCGQETVTTALKLRSGHTRSCGCLFAEAVKRSRTRHGHSRSPEYAVWSSAKNRCENHKCNSFPSYGGRGIKMCKRWRDDFANFLADMGRRPRGTTLDRINVNGGYRPGNCRWATVREQQTNRRNTIHVPHEGRMVCLKEYASIHGVEYIHLYHRVKYRGIAPQTAVTLLKRPRVI